MLLLIQSLNPLQFDARDQDCVLAGRTGFGVDKKKSSRMDMEQQVNGDRMEADHKRLDYRIFTDDEDVTLLPHKRDTEVPDNLVGISVMDQIRRIHNEKTGYFRRSPFMGLAQGGPIGSALR